MLELIHQDRNHMNLKHIYLETMITRFVEIWGQESFFIFHMLET